MFPHYSTLTPFVIPSFCLWCETFLPKTEKEICVSFNADRIVLKCQIIEIRIVCLVFDLNRGFLHWYWNIFISIHLHTNKQPKINVFLRDICEISFIKSRLLCVFNTFCLPCCLLRFKCHVFWLVPIKSKYYFQFVYEISGTFSLCSFSNPIVTTS